MEVLAPIPLHTRVEWIELLTELASSRMAHPEVFARGVEHLAYQKRQTQNQIAHGVIVYRYGDVDVLDIDCQAAHVSAALTCYTKVLRRVAWALHGGKSLQIHTPEAWIEAGDDVLVEGTAHSEWERGFFAQQDLAREILAGKGGATKGIFACTRCKSFDVDTEQKQTRSADEPMTIFCTCNVCGKRFVR